MPLSMKGKGGRIFIYFRHLTKSLEATAGGRGERRVGRQGAGEVQLTLQCRVLLPHHSWEILDPLLLQVLSQREQERPGLVSRVGMSSKRGQRLSLSSWSPTACCFLKPCTAPVESSSSFSLSSVGQSVKLR